MDYSVFRFYKGEDTCPFDSEIEYMLWSVERSASNNIDNIYEAHPDWSHSKALADHVAGVIAGHAPYDLKEAMERYFRDDDTDKDYFFPTYEI